MKTLLTASALALLSQTAIAQETTIRFLHINDLHAHLTPHADRVVAADGSISLEQRGGIARLATLLKQQRAENPNNITMNIGDTFHGGAEALFSMGNAIVGPVNALGIDIGVAGNWDFAYSPGVSRMRFGPVDFFGLLPKLPDANLPATNLPGTNPSNNIGEILPGNNIIEQVAPDTGTLADTMTPSDTLAGFTPDSTVIENLAPQDNLIEGIVPDSNMIGNSTPDDSTISDKLPASSVFGGNFFSSNKLAKIPAGSNEDAFKIGYPGGFLDEPFPILRPNYTSLGANVRDIFVPWNFMPATQVITVDGVKVGLIGLTSDIVEDMHVFMGLGFAFTKGEDNYRKLINKHASALRKQGADIVVVMSELGIHKDNKLAQIIDAGSVDVIFSAHTHETTHQPLSSKSGALVVEAGNDGWLGQMDITVDDSKNVIDRQWKLLAIDDSIAADADMQALVDEARAPYLADDVNMLAPPFMMQQLHQSLDTVIGHTETTVDRKDALESTFNAGWTDMLRQITDTDVAITPGFRMDTTLVEPGYLYEDNTVASGDITLEDAYRLFPVVYLLAAGEIDGAGLRQVIEDQLTSTFSADVFKHTGGWNYGISGVDVTLDLAAKDGARIAEMTYSNGDPVRDDDMLKVGGCMRIIDTPNRLCSIKGFSKVLPLPSPDKKPFWTALDAFVYSLSSQNFNGSRISMTDTSATPRWPEDDFIQPLEGVGGSSAEDDKAPAIASMAYLPLAMLSLLLVRRRSVTA